MRAWHNDPALKERTMAQLRAHHEADEIVRGIYWKRRGEHYVGCHLGCLLHKDADLDDAIERELGIDRRVGRLLEAVFERGVEGKDAPDWVIRSTEAIPVGANTTRVWHRWAEWLCLVELRQQTDDEIVRAVGLLHQRAAGGESVSTREWAAAVAAAAAAAAAASAAAGWSAAAATEAAASWSAAAAMDAAASAAAGWSAAAARSGAWQRMEDKLLELLRDEGSED